jgi:hypothetical protein
MYHSMCRVETGRCLGSNDHLQDNKSHREDSRYSSRKVLNLLDNIRLPFDNRSGWNHHNSYRHKAFGLPDSSLQDGQLKQVNYSQYPEREWIRLAVQDNDWVTCKV